MHSEGSVRYLRCVGPDISDNPAGASVVLVRLQRARGEDWFAGYVILNDRDEVLEKSHEYGQFEEEDDWIERQNTCTVVSREEFSSAWQRPYARRSLKRRILSSLNGTCDCSDPSQDDPGSQADPPP